MTPSCINTRVSVPAESKFEDISRKLYMTVWRVLCAELVYAELGFFCRFNLNFVNLTLQLSYLFMPSLNYCIQQISELSKKK